jgi:DNA-3-methyladenine glycosylase II
MATLSIRAAGRLPPKPVSPMAHAAVELRAIPPFDFQMLVHYMRIWPAAVLEKVEDGGYRRAVNIAGQDTVLALHSVGTPAQPRIVLEIFGARADKAVVKQASALVRRTLRLDDDPVPFLKAAQTDPVLARIVERLQGIRPIQIIDPFEAVLWTILGQQINLAFARRLKLALIEMCGRHLEINGERLALFPRPADAMMLDPLQARARQFSRQKVEYIKVIAAAVDSGRLDFEALRAGPQEDALRALTAIKGIGRWTAEYLLIRALGFADAIPAADVGLRRAIGEAYGMDGNATETQVRTLAAKWDGWRGWAAFYFWLERLLALYGNLTSAPQTTS